MYSNGICKRRYIGEKIQEYLNQDIKIKKFGDDLWNDLKVKGSWSGEVYNKKQMVKFIPLRSTITAIKDKEEKLLIS